MKINKIFMGILILSISLFLAACTPSNSPDDNENDGNNELEEEIEEKNAEIEEKNMEIEELETRVEELSGQIENLATRTFNVLESLKEKDMESLKEYIHPQKGLRFTPYPYVDLEEDIVLEKDEIVDAYSSSQTYNWG
ncbi:MAG: hypothetical protein ACTHW2_05755, partial [Tissierella sp.]|uniref:hypothetical protein n=1 Tax=Tissierella sp. TaxID=41274 RepID=UPI003F96779B